MPDSVTRTFAQRCVSMREFTPYLAARAIAEDWLVPDRRTSLVMKTLSILSAVLLSLSHSALAQQATQSSGGGVTSGTSAGATGSSGQRSASTTAAGSETGRPTTEAAGTGATSGPASPTPAPQASPSSGQSTVTGNTGNGSQFKTNNPSGVKQPGTGTLGTGVGTER